MIYDSYKVVFSFHHSVPIETYIIPCCKQFEVPTNPPTELTAHPLGWTGINVMRIRILLLTRPMQMTTNRLLTLCSSFYCNFGLDKL